ncbi:MAG: hypothetical protein ACLSVD_09770 [Eggerthellaceae bacterium]
MVEHPFEEGAAEKRSALEEQLDAAAPSSPTPMESAGGFCRSRARGEAANQVVAAIARRTLIETGAQLVAASASGPAVRRPCGAAWSHLLEADELA